jgi:hypothetical protein
VSPEAISGTGDWLQDRRVSWMWPAAFGIAAIGWLGVPDPGGSLLAAAAFAVAGGLCVANARYCRRAHCTITGPLYLLAALLFVARVVGTMVPSGLIVAGSVVGTILAYVPEWLGLRYLPGPRGRNAPAVELLYDRDCPNAPEARANLERGFAQAGVRPEWTEWELSSGGTPARVRGFGSPTVLVNGRDVAGAEPADAACCRVYEVAGRRRGAPPPELIARALSTAAERTVWRRAMLVVPAAGVALVPGLTCPACWPGYAALLSALGLGFIPTAPYLLPLTSGFLLVALAAMAFRAKSRVPFLIGLAASVAILLGKFAFDSTPTTYTGVGLLLAASFSNLRLRGAATCPACAPQSPARQGSAATPSMQGR